MTTIDLGDKVRDPITGFTGIVVAKTRWLNGCDRVSVQSRELKDGKPQESVGFDDTQLELIEARAIDAPNREPPKLGSDSVPVRKTGGPRPEVQRWDDAP